MEPSNCKDIYTRKNGTVIDVIDFLIYGKPRSYDTSKNSVKESKTANCVHNNDTTKDVGIRVEDICKKGLAPGFVSNVLLLSRHSASHIPHRTNKRVSIS